MKQTVLSISLLSNLSTHANEEGKIPCGRGEKRNRHRISFPRGKLQISIESTFLLLFLENNSFFSWFAGGLQQCTEARGRRTRVRICAERWTMETWLYTKKKGYNQIKLHTKRKIGTNERVSQWTNERMNEWKNERMKEWANERMSEWANERMNEWANERMSEWTNERMKEWKNERMKERTNERMNEWTNERRNKLTYERMNE